MVMHTFMFSFNYICVRAPLLDSEKSSLSSKSVGDQMHFNQVDIYLILFFYLNSTFKV